MNWWCQSSSVKDKEGIIANGVIRGEKTLSMSPAYILWSMSTFNQQNLGISGKTIGSFHWNVLFWLKLMLKSRGYAVVDYRSDTLLIISRGDMVNANQSPERTAAVESLLIIYRIIAGSFWCYFIRSAKVNLSFSVTANSSALASLKQSRISGEKAPHSPSSIIRAASFTA